jgi:1-acyl-sn-glycerol-3-phosphate acyltransferase
MTRAFGARLVGSIVVGFARALTGVRARWVPESGARGMQTLYFANHASHGDFVLVWATLPPDVRAVTRPVAAADYWGTSGLRRFVGAEVFRALLIDRVPKPDGPDPVRQMADTLLAGDSLIMFPEGTRNTSDEPLLPFRSGLYRLARECPGARLVPVWIENLKRVLPKGAIVPLPLACTVHYGAPIALEEGEEKAAFLARARGAMLALRPDDEREERR